MKSQNKLKHYKKRQNLSGYKSFFIIGIIIFIIGGLLIVFWASREKEKTISKPINQTFKETAPKVVVKDPYHKSIPILMYHHIRDYYNPNDPMENEMSTSPTNFQTEMNLLIENGYQTITFKQLLEGDIPVKPIIVSFDDGYQNNYDIAYPILKKNNQVGTFFVLSGATSGNGYLTKNEIREMAESGMEFGSHTVSHPNLLTIMPSEIKNQLDQSKQELSLITGQPIEVFSYPNGQYNETIKKAVTTAGYKAAVSITDKATSSDPLALPRINVQGWDNEEKVMKKITNFSKFNDQYIWDY